VEVTSAAGAWPVLGVGHLMLAFLDHWLGQRPVSDDLNQALLGAT
jgi:hypothetical protein